VPVELLWLDQDRALECPVCGFAGTGAQVAEVNALGRVGIEVVRCPVCSSVRMSGEVGDVTPDDPAIDAYIEAGAGIDAIASGLAVPDPSSVRRMLDVGCNYGFGMDLGRHLFGWQTLGVEPSPAGARGAAELGLDIRPEYVTDSTRFDDPFDLVLASEVLEHVPDPGGFLRTLARLLTPSGTLVLTTPAAEAVDPGNIDELVLIALSPGFHCFLASAGGLERLLHDAGFASVSVRRDGGTLRARASLAPGVTLESVKGLDRLALEYYYDVRARDASPGSALANGMATRHFRSVMNRGDFETAEVSALRAIGALRDRHGFDLENPASVAAELRSGAVPAWNLAGIAYALGMLELLGRDRPGRAADYFDLVLVTIDAWRAYAGLLDGDSANLRPIAARHRALAIARSSPTEAATAFFDSAPLLDEPATTLTRLQVFTELVTAGHAKHVAPLVAGVTATAPAAATASDPVLRRAACDALYCLATSTAADGDLTASAAWSAKARTVLDADAPEDAVLLEALERHDTLLSELTAAAAGGEAPSAPAVTAQPAHGVEVYWTDASGTYVSGWAHHGHIPVTAITLRRGDAVVGQEPTLRPDLARFWPEVAAVVHSGFALYLPGAPDAPLDLKVTTASGSLCLRLDLPDHPVPPPRWDDESPLATLPDHLARVLEGAAAGPVLAIGLRGHDTAQADDFRAALAGREVIVADIHAGPGVDVVVDAHDLTSVFRPHQFAAVYSSCLLEHLAAPWLMAAQVNRVLMPGGLSAHLAPTAWPEHAQPSDFWRFTRFGMHELFGPRTGFEVVTEDVGADVRLHPAGAWGARQHAMPTLATPALAWLIARKTRDLDPDEVRWPYDAQEVMTDGSPYPVGGLTTEDGVVRLNLPQSDGAADLHNDAAEPAPDESAPPGAQSPTPVDEPHQPARPVADVSVILPVYNGAAYVTDAIRSVAAQTLQPIELVVVDDGSGDGSADVVRGMHVPFRLTVISQRNQGQSAARNAGAALASGKYLAFVDQDDQWHRNHLATLVPLLDEDPDVGWAFTDFDEVDQDGQTVTHSFIHERGITQPKGSVATCISGDIMALPSASLMRRDAVLATGGFDPDLRGYEDDDLFVRMFRSGWGHRFVPVSTARYRVHANGSSADLSFLRSRMRYLDKLVESLKTDHRLNRDLIHDAALPRFFQATLGEYTQAIALQEYDSALELATALRKIASMEERHGWRRRIELATIAHPRRLRWVLVRIARLPGWLQPRINPDLDLRTRTAVRAELRGC
jgi:glycosyltransferase involved in cell wall biosynthesis/SAM-dependent methyltransferase